MWDGAVGYISVFAVLGAVATATTVLRLWSARLVRNTYHSDDWLLLLTLLTHHAFTGVIIAAFAREHLGDDTAWVAVHHPASIPGLRKLLFVLTLLFGLTTTTVRLSVLIFYWRILNSKLVRRGCVVLITVCVAWFFAYELSYILVCLPVESQWTGRGRDKCVAIPRLQIFAGFFNSLVDVATVILPIREVWNLHLSPWKKRSIIGVFLIGGLASIVSLVRAVASVISASSGAARISGPSYAFLPSTICIEIYLAIIGACAPTLVPAYRRIRHGKDYVVTTTKTPSRPSRRGDHWTDIASRAREDPSTDEVPLQGIRVTNEISWKHSEPEA
jgi:hypothetical protein